MLAVILPGMSSQQACLDAAERVVQVPDIDRMCAFPEYQMLFMSVNTLYFQEEMLLDALSSLGYSSCILVGARSLSLSLSSEMSFPKRDP